MAMVLLAGALAFLVWKVADVLLVVFAGILLAMFLRSLADALARVTGWNDGWCFTIAMALLVAVLGAMIWFLGAEIVDQLGQLVPSVQKAWGQLKSYLRHYEWGRIVLANASLKAFAQNREAWMSGLAGVFSTAIGAISSILVIFFIGIYVAASPDTYQKGMLQIFPQSWRPRATELLGAMATTLRWWLIGTFAKMVMVGTATTIGLWLLDMPLAMALGLIAFLLEFVPYFGPILAAIPALLVGLAISPMDMVYVGAVYLAVQAAENYIISPLVDQRSVKLPPALAVSAQIFLGASSLGVLGVVLATPLTAVGLVLVKMLYIEDRLGECTDATDACQLKE